MSDNLVISPENVNLPKMNAFQRVISAVFSPGKLMSDLEQKPRVLLGIILSVINPAIVMLGAYPMFKEYLKTTLEMSNANTGTELAPEALDSLVNLFSILTPISGAAMGVVFMLIQALILWLVLKIFKGQGSFKQILSVLGYSQVINFLSAIVFILTTYLTGTYSDFGYTSLAAVLPDLRGNFIFGMAKSIDVFDIWYYVCAAIGVATVSKIDKKKVYLVLIIMFLALAAYSGYSELRAAALLK